MIGGGNSGGNGYSDGGDMSSWTRAASRIPTAKSPNNFLGKIAISVGAAAISAGYATLSTEEGRNFISSYLKNCFSGELSKIDASDLDGS